MIHASVSLPGYQLAEQIYNGSRTLVYHGMRNADEKPVIIKFLRNEYPTFSELLQFRNQYTIAKNLDLSGIVKPLALEIYRKGYALVMPDGGLVSLQNWRQAQSPVNSHQLPIAEFLKIAIQLSDILHRLYQNRVIHKDIKPANILIHPDSKQVKLIDFSISSLLPKETQEIQNPNVLEGTLAYISPEQTGRMNRGIDYRSDFYSLGVTFYELLTGQLPFQSDDPMELVHCHIAKTAPPLRRGDGERGGLFSHQSTVNSHQLRRRGEGETGREEIPQVISEIVLKLMAKNVEDRYQSALGLKYDLEKCLSQWQQTGTIEGFELGKRDVRDRFIIPEKLYGREAEVAQLLTAFERISQENSDLRKEPLSPSSSTPTPPRSELMLVAGYSGVGKTAVINEIHKPIVRQRGYFIKGKFDQFNRNIPFSAFVQAFRDLMGQLFSESDSQLKQWKSKMLSALGESAQVIIDVIPELEEIIGKQPPIPELSGSAAQNRFNLLFSKFIQVFATQEHPLVLFLDDLQWADSASLNLIKLLMGETETSYLLVLGAYRDNEVYPAHPLMLALDEVKKSKAIVNTIILTPLTQSGLNYLIADTLSCSLELAVSLTELVYQKTKGNPFFATQFLKGLYEDGEIAFNSDVGYWQCDMARIRQLSLTDDVVKFMVGRLQKLPEATQEILKLAACIGNQFDLETLAIVCEEHQAEVADDFWSALQEGLILPINETYKFFQGDVQESKAQNVTVVYRFLHDRVQQAAYSLIPDEDKQVTHLKIGERLLEETPEDKLNEKIFEIVNQLNVGIESRDRNIDREQFARLNLMAGRQAKAATANKAVAEYLAIARSLLSATSWEEHYPLMLALYQESAEAAYLNADFEQMEQFASIVQNRARNILDIVPVYEVKMQAGMAQNQLPEAVQTGRDVLQLLGIVFPENPNPSDIETTMSAIFSKLDGRNPLSLIDLPLMTEPANLASMRILKSLAPCAYQAMPMLLPLVVMKQVELSIDYGNATLSPLGYAYFALILCGVVGELETGYQFGQLALNLLDRFNAKEIQAGTLFVINADVRHYQEPVKATLQPLQSAYTLGLETGDLEFAALSTSIYVYHAYLTAQPISELHREINSYNQALIRLKQKTALHFNQILQQALSNLMSFTEEPCKLRGEFYDDREMLPLHQEANDATAIYYIYFNQMILCYLLGEFQQAVENAVETEKYLYGVTANLVVPLFYFYDSLVRLADGVNTESQNILEKVRVNQEKMQHWANYAPMNFQHKFDLVEAEKYRVLGQKLEALDRYDVAIVGAKANEYLQEEALANELAAKFYLDWGKEKIAQTYMVEAYYCYARWGAKAKTDQLEATYPQLLVPIFQQKSQIDLDATLAWNSSQTITSQSSSSTSSALDFSAALKASQAISEEIQLDGLLSTLMQVVIRNAGADKGVLIVSESGDWVVRAMATLNASSEDDLAIHTVLSCPIEESEEIPSTLIRYVSRTVQLLVINDVTVDTAFAGDAYFASQSPQSLMCAPIVRQGRAIGILYLENGGAKGSFTRDRVEVLNLLTTQAAISLDNAQLYQKSQDYAQKLSQSLEDLQNAQLQLVQNEKMATLGNLVAGVAHEINNPLSFIGGNVGAAKDYIADLFEIIQHYQKELPNPSPKLEELLEDLDLDFIEEDLPKLIASMSVGVKRIRNISTSLRTFSRSDSSEKTAFNLHDGIDSTILILKYRLKANEQRPAIAILKDYGKLPEVQCFPGQLNQVFMNLLANAIDAFEEFNIGRSYAEIEANPNQIIIRTERAEKSSEIIIRISDNGPGMSEKVQQKVFEHLFTTKGVGKGTGLGLSISRKIVEEKHEGKLICTSERGKGTEFAIHLPS